jgi:hypothetical protein
MPHDGLWGGEFVIPGAEPAGRVRPREGRAALVGTLLSAVLVVAASCTLGQSPTPAATQPALGNAVLSVDSRGGPAVIVKIGAVEAARVDCNGSAVLAPGVNGLPALPWSVTVATQKDARVMLEATVASLPQWLLLFGDAASLSSTPVAGPQGPPCPSSQ